MHLVNDVLKTSHLNVFLMILEANISIHSPGQRGVKADGGVMENERWRRDGSRQRLKSESERETAFKRLHDTLILLLRNQLHRCDLAPLEKKLPEKLLDLDKIERPISNLYPHFHILNSKLRVKEIFERNCKASNSRQIEILYLILSIMIQNVNSWIPHHQCSHELTTNMRGCFPFHKSFVITESLDALKSSIDNGEKVGVRSIRSGHLFFNFSFNAAATAIASVKNRDPQVSIQVYSLRFEFD
ncbi:hypothetical protein RND71_026312 [Anisodus tanguticus]|uniref:Uncharacterized protein n=1 Tax=Anisodus tanguticus TaxID=243964 RepID=A0AAE1RM02_9SOLA|nr:hypothetical protein RND71_026312 [Anisodus tanguticus]